MKDKQLIFIIICIGLFLYYGCKKEDHALLPEVKSYELINDSEVITSAKGTVISDGGAKVIERGICWSSNPIPTINDKKTIEGAGVGDFTSKLTGLVQGTTYFARAYATNRKGTTYGDVLSFIAGTVTDLDGNLYNMVTIGSQIWMKENLKTTKYRNGDAIPNIPDDKVWSSLSIGAQCDYNNDFLNVTKFGKLYNWYAVYDSRKIAPKDWHVASDEEWTTLTKYVANNLSNSGSIAKALASNTGWTYSINVNAVGNDLTRNNSTGFSAYASGKRNINGIFGSIGDIGIWWSSTESSKGIAWYRDIDFGSASVYRDVNQGYGFAVRCIKD